MSSRVAVLATRLRGTTIYITSTMYKYVAVSGHFLIHLRCQSGRTRTLLHLTSIETLIACSNAAWLVCELFPIPACPRTREGELDERRPESEARVSSPEHHRATVPKQQTFRQTHPDCVRCVWVTREWATPTKELLVQAAYNMHSVSALVPQSSHMAGQSIVGVHAALWPRRIPSAVERSPVIIHSRSLWLFSLRVRSSIILTHVAPLCIIPAVSSADHSSVK